MMSHAEDPPEKAELNKSVTLQNKDENGDGSGGLHPLSQIIDPGTFDPQAHWYERSVNAQIHPLVRFFCSLSTEQIVTRYCHMNPRTIPEVLHRWLLYSPKYLAWSGADLFHVTSAHGKRQMVVIEVNSSPSGQKSMPPLYEDDVQGGYRKLIERTFLPRLLQRRRLPSGGLAILYDKNAMEATGYAAAMADAFQEPVYLVPSYRTTSHDFIKFEDRVLHVKCPKKSEWVPIRGAFRYITQQPWSRIPVHTRTFILNPIVACLAGGRNKLVAAKAYDLFNAELAAHGLKIQIPYTIWDVSQEEVPLWVNRLGGKAVVKVPYSNAGQGVFTIVNQEELNAFSNTTFRYKSFIVQSLIGNYGWSSKGHEGLLYHIGTVPTSQGCTYVADVRMMIHHTVDGWKPLALYARRAQTALTRELQEGANSWAMLGTNLSVKKDDGSWGTDTSRLLMFDRKDFNLLGLGIDDLIEGFVQTILATIAIDLMADKLTSEKGTLKSSLFRSINNDPSLHAEIES
jgi:hypothetical protein